VTHASSPAAGDGAERHLLHGNLLFGRFDLLVSQLQAA
jgi:putative protein-disulfide isomerase